MKLFTRKTVLAGATALAVAFSGATIATAQNESTPATTSATPSPSATSTPTDSPEPATETTTVTTTVKETATSTPTQDTSSALSSGNSSEVNAKDITAWISVFTAVIGALGTLFTFVNRNFKLF